jgi:hypothetical protein
MTRRLQIGAPEVLFAGGWGLTFLLFRIHNLPQSLGLLVERLTG